MKNFLELRATDLKIQVVMVLKPITDNGSPRCTVTVNGDRIFCKELAQTAAICTTVSLHDPLSLSIAMQDKIYSSQKETAIVIESIKIDQFELVPGWTHLATYQYDHAQADARGYIGFNGTWRFVIPKPFYLWRHEVTGQGWLLEPTTVVRDCVPNSSNTTANRRHIDFGNTVATKDSTTAPQNGPDDR